MITSFSVKNFRCFNEWTNFDFTSDKKYEFNENAVSNEVIQHAMLYGENGEGKTNIGCALLEIISHVSQKKVKYPTYENSYLNSQSESDLAEFEYIFKFNNKLVSYSYGKDESADIVYEKFMVEGKVLLEWNKTVSNLAKIELEGAESLNKELSDNITSLVSYVINNASLSESENNSLFLQFTNFVGKMVFFKTMSNVNQFAGAIPYKHKSISEQIINEYGVEALEAFLIENGIKCKLETYESVDGKKIADISGNKPIDFFSIASSGTFALVILFVWLEKMKNQEISFAYIDEFDAFYHHKLAKNIAYNISKLPLQTILSTHNTSIMTNNILRPDCYFEIKNKKIKPLYKLSDRELRKAHNLEKMYRSGAFDE
ncbi:AAA family ATPase [Aliivibrio fischeri]|uniref:AAA family ATPase n=1 Tax=Aliivibrio fischeri TaxID=668 RepID=UPI001F36DC74|nr:AAA family ATPase [Aliivibrio fischeri]MCE7554233.1 ATP-binding protein [Aliivibrio fischeri]MCE7560915.1 ATP-binding protein [Aliivibrio fischeri]MCE7568324.1 ATP-binding protein [Aliivibrio fischeri]